MSQFLTCVKSYTVFFLLMMILIHLVPKDGYRKYIQFFMGMLLVFAFLSPVLTLLFDSEEFLDLVEFETFQEQLEELEKDTNRIEFVQQDYYEEQCKKMTQQEIEQVALAFDYEMLESEITFDEEGDIETITLVVREQAEGITIKEVRIGTEQEITNKNCIELQEALQTYYQLDEGAVVVSLEKDS